MQYESCTVAVLTEEEDKDYGGDVVDTERYEIARGEDPLDELDIGEWVETPRPTFISHNLAPEHRQPDTISPSPLSPPTAHFPDLVHCQFVDNSGTVVGIRCKDGVILGVEKLIVSKMMLPVSNWRIHSVHRHAGMAIAGLTADGRQIVARAKGEATSYKSTYGETIPVKELDERVASHVHLCT
ncbi:hypothetical protein Droror1_Dr00024587, partial [Drosera rotundifolia]